MNNSRIIVSALALCLGGAAVFWLTAPQPHAPPPATGATAEVRHAFALTAADLKLDRERPSLAVAGDNVVLAWASQTGPEENTLYVARSGDRGTTFAPPVALRRFAIEFRKSRMRDREVIRPSEVLPRLSSAGGRITLGWMEPGPRTDGKGDRPMRFLVAHSRDGGLTFTEPVCAHGPGAGRPNFTALSTGEDGSTACAWIDNRGHAQQPYVGLIREDVPAEGLVYSGPNGKGICPCCDVDVARAPSGATLVAFRNSLAGNRDIYVARAADGTKFDAAVPVSPDHWSFDGCPHDGPSLAVSGGRVFTAWMSGHSSKQQVYLASAAIADMAFTPRRLGPPSAGDQGHPRIAAAGKTLHAVWDEALAASPPGSTHGHQHSPPPAGSSRAIVYTCSTDDGTTFAPPRRLAPMPGTFQVRPTVAVDAGGGVHVAWSELTDEGKRVVYLRPTFNSPAEVAVPSSSDSGHQGQRGQRLYQTYCQTCHGPEGHGDGNLSANMKPPPRDFAVAPWKFGAVPDTVERLIRDGSPGTAMPGFGLLSGDDRAALGAFVLSLAPPAARETPALPANLSAALSRLGFAPVERPAFAPGLALSDLDGRAATLDRWRGRVVLLSFWGTSCSHCLDELPELAKLAEEVGSGFAVVPVCIDETDTAMVRKLVEGRVRDLPVYVNSDGRARARFDVQALPSVFLIDPAGRLIGQATGGRARPAADVRQLVGALKE